MSELVRLPRALRRPAPFSAYLGVLGTQEPAVDRPDAYVAQAPGSTLPPAVVLWGGRGQNFTFGAPYNVSDPATGREFTIPAGFKFNGASALRIVWWFFSPLDAGPIAAGCHDYLYSDEAAGQVVAGSYTRAESDRLFLGHMVAEAVAKLRRRAAYTAVRRLGRPRWRR